MPADAAPVWPSGGDDVTPREDNVRALLPALAPPGIDRPAPRPPREIPASAGRPRTDARAALMTGDAVMVIVASMIAVATWAAAGSLRWAWGAGFALACLTILRVRGFYAFRLGASIVSALGQILIATTLAAMLLISVAAFVTGSAHLSGLAAHLWISATASLSAWRTAVALESRWLWSRDNGLRPTLVIGAGKVGRLMAQRLQDRPELGMDPIGYIDDEPRAGSDDDLPVLGRTEDLSRAIGRHRVTHAIITFSRTPDVRMRRMMCICQERGVEVLVVPRIYEQMTSRLTIEHVGGIPLLRAERTDPSGWQFALKYGMDRVVAFVLVALSAPLLLGIALLVRLSSPGPIFFRQRRVGRDGQEFTMLKFRTMRGSPSEAGEADAAWAAQISGEVRARVPEVDRTTPVGRILRRSSLDELPQLVNVLRGEMSLVGPRPERTGYVRQFEGLVYRYRDRHRVKSGLTGWAQVHQLRGETSLADRVEWDNYYIENWSLRLDLRILLMTLPAAVRGTGARDRRADDDVAQDRERVGAASG